MSKAAIEWTEEKNEELRVYWENGYPDWSIAEHFGLDTTGPIRWQRIKLGLVQSRRGPNGAKTDELRQIIKENPEKSGHKLAEELDLSPSWVCRVRKELGIPNTTYQRWEDWQLKILRDDYPTHGARVVAARTGLPMKKVWTKASQEGLRRE